MKGRETEHIWKREEWVGGHCCGGHEIQNSHQFSMICHPSQWRKTFCWEKIKATNKHRILALEYINSQLLVKFLT